MVVITYTCSGVTNLSLCIIAYDTFTRTVITVDPTTIVVIENETSYPAGHTIIIVVCTVMGGLIIVFLAFLILTVCYFSHSPRSWGHHKFSPSRTTHDNSSRLSTASASASETEPNSVCLTHSTNVLDGSSYDSFLKQQQHHSVSQISLETAVTQETYHYQPPNTPTTNKSVHFGTDSVAYRSRAESPLTFNDTISYAGPCPSMTGAGDDMSNITSVSEVAKRRYVREYMRQQMLRDQMHQQQEYAADTEDYGDSTSITSVDTKMTFNSVNDIQPPPPSLVSHSIFTSPHDDGDDGDDGDDDD